MRAYELTNVVHIRIVLISIFAVIAVFAAAAMSLLFSMMMMFLYAVALYT